MSCSNGMSFFPPNYLLQNSFNEENHHPQSLLPQDLHVSGFTSFLGKRSPVNNIESCCDLEEDYSDEGSQMGDKKRRLNMEQVKTLEKNFELGNKLEPERKMQLARALNLQPRQIAIWFQNRRARWKTKQLEKDYDTLKRQFDNLKAENEILQTHNHKLQLQIMALKSKEPTESINLNKDTEGSCSNRSDNTSDNLRLDIATAPPSIESTLTGGQPPVGGTDGRQLFSPASAPTTTTMQFFQNSTSGQSMVKEENSMSNMFCGIDDQTGFWPWLDNQQYH